ncbi:hypothetical protein CNMCM8980_000254 [Aspergillus fumigatiaffinis]|uniref:DUF3835 domain-containing protein n=1 Tax=Aspergillus fumigatiaffinis TaxID=340414 RepID=A0A8H4LZD1_9EURO|nr:hypothetical protein CNMCM5878_000609 [Aspergillus fumigatiaffinis]KAF4223256.1 hypothetical protein CNMCM6457_000599 [Aspergillus fumigatiaffinis]KAF4230856.1 hypothetical protein CNMCM6805_000547 [Aspergillus fumigatiaffinis]KAF4242882.1 hypothetical protein CNMCM8980_000254 [Aspergillus fumigatiaffinis]
MGVPDSHLQDLERQRLELEDNILKLQESLYHWRTWEAEYDGLKEEISNIDDDATTSDFLRIGRNFGGSLVNEDEVKVILGDKQGVTRSRQQVIDLISRRIDYVKENVATMEKRLRKAESQLYALGTSEQLPSEPTADFQMTEIMEELDDDGNVISSSTSTPGNQAPELLEILKKAGVKDISEVPKRKDTENAADDRACEAEEIQAPGPKDHQAEKQDESTMPSKSLAEMQEEQPITDIDEPPEDAELRREMLRYSLDEVGAVVAELELDEDADEVSVDEEYDYDDDEEEEEDEFGRTRPVLDEDYHQQMRELEKKLNAKGLWNVGKDTTSLPEDIQKELERPAVVRVEKSDDSVDTAVKENKPKKKVAFAEELDIAPAPKPAVHEKKTLPPKQPEVPTMAESVVERTQQTGKTPAASSGPKKASRFKSAREAITEEIPSVVPPTNGIRASDPRPSHRKPAAPTPDSIPLFPAKPRQPKPFSQPISDIIEKPSPPPQPEGPEGKILADTLIERTVSEGAVVAPEPDELDEQLHRKEIATEFYRMRNRQIQQNGGFVDDEPEMVPIDTDEAPKRVSKFKAARMRQS